MKHKDIFICLVTVVWHLEAVGDASQRKYDLVYPERLTSSKGELFTRLTKNNADGGETVKIKIPLSNGSYMLDLKKKSSHYLDALHLTTGGGIDEFHRTKRPVRDCHYEGTVNDNANSHAYISLCHGVLGTIFDGTKSYDIMPADDEAEGAHKLIDADEIQKILAEQLFNDSPGDVETLDTYVATSHKSNKSSHDFSQFRIGDVEPQYIPYLPNNKTRFIEALVCVDYEVYLHYDNNTDMVIERVLNTIGQVDVSYQAINIRIVVVAIDIHTNGQVFKRERSGGGDLASFSDYVKRKFRRSDKTKDIPFDNAIFLSSRGYANSVVGMAFSGSLCTEYSTSVNAWSFTDISGPVFVIGHELGHNLNFPHDGGDCHCLSHRGCFMRNLKSSRPGFSDCSLRWFAQKDFPCLSNYPSLTITRECGNGIIEGDEQCDCGTQEMCIKNDPCCEPYRCRLKSHAQCSYQNHPDCCTDQCLYKKQGNICRVPKGNCDVPEYCTGVSPECPLDNVMRNGVQCGDSIKMVFGTTKGHVITSTSLSPHIYGRYFKFIPKLWSKSKSTCMKVEMLGCEKEEVNTYLPTPISTERLYYHKPMCLMLRNITSCSQVVTDGTPLIYQTTEHYDCNHEHMLFIHNPDGSLVHKCSGKVLCPDSRDYLITATSKCSSENSQFKRTKDSQVKHVKTGKCFNSFDWWPGSGKMVAIHKGCEKLKDTTRLIFQRTDCLFPIGFENRKLKDSAFSASSFLKNHPPSMARIEQKGWCAPVLKTKTSWLMVDIGELKKITMIQISGRGNEYVAGYHLMYSEDNIHWQSYKESHAESWKDNDSFCYDGECVLTHDHQCKQLWNADAAKADQICWKKLNTEVNDYGTCNSLQKVSCSIDNMYCGQLQCWSPAKKPYYVDFATKYKQLNIEGKTCSAASVTKSEQVGLGMVHDGTKCGPDKMCVNRKCKSLNELAFKLCPTVNGKECNGKGVCRSDGRCYCEYGLNPDDGCATEHIPVNGGWSRWSDWNKCSKACGGGTRMRHRYCNQPITRHGGKDCVGWWKDNNECNTAECPVARSCRALKLIFESQRKPLYDGVYTIQPAEGYRTKTYCDFNRDGGGWTLLVTSHTNTWTSKNVLLRNHDDPDLRKDYSILKYADMIKFSYLSSSPTFDYRLEAEQLGKWGGVFSAPSTYLINSNNSQQTNIKLIRRFSNWTFSPHGIEERLPYVYNQRLTTSSLPNINFWGTITDNRTEVTPSNWIKGSMKMGIPNWIWYWVRESAYSYPKSCLETMYRGYHEEQPFKSGMYRIEPKPGHLVLTYCDFDRHGGGWTLLSKSTNVTAWKDREESLKYGDLPSSHKFSILKFIDDIKQKDTAEKTFEYMIEADGADQNGGIFTLPADFSLLVCPPRNRKPKLIKKFGDWNESKENLAHYAIHSASKNGEIFFTASSDENSDTGGSLISNMGAGFYMTSYKKPSEIKVWIREGGSYRSCNDIKIHGLHKGKTDYKNGFYMLQGSQSVYCDMTTTKNEGWTLLVTSATGGWKPSQVLSRNRDKPSLTKDYSILEQGDKIKSLSTKENFKYMLDAHSRCHWGGIWSSSQRNSFTSSKANQYDVLLLEKFDVWDYKVRWWNNIQPRMPYLGDASKHKALLTTASYSFWYEWGSIISDDNRHHTPSMWITPQMPAPGVIWYWVNENDCDKDYSRIHGGYEQWSMWTPCSSFCGEGRQSRKRDCTSPKPRCGGEPCPSNEKTFEERNCNGTCQDSTLRTIDDNFCIVPESNSCDVEDDTRLVLKSAISHCHKREARFIFHATSGKLIHLCSNKTVCPQGGHEKEGNLLVISSKCPEPTLSHHLSRTLWNSIQFGYYCLGTRRGKFRQSDSIGLFRDCTLANRKLVFSELSKGHVYVSKFDKIPAIKTIDSVKGDARFPSLPTSEGFMDNLDSPYNVGSMYALRMWTYFKAPQSGNYVFVAACDDMCQVLLSEHKDTNRKVIIDVKSWTKHYQWDRNPKEQQSAKLPLHVGIKYYMEVILGEASGGDYVSVGVYLPDGTSLLPITYEYLSLTIE